MGLFFIQGLLKSLKIIFLDFKNLYEIIFLKCSNQYISVLVNFCQCVKMEVLDGIVKHPVSQDSMVISVQCHASVRLTSVINRPGVSHHIMRHVSEALALTTSGIAFFFYCERE